VNPLRAWRSYTPQGEYKERSADLSDGSQDLRGSARPGTGEKRGGKVPIYLWVVCGFFVWGFWFVGWGLG